MAVPREIDIREWRSAQRGGGLTGAWSAREADNPTGTLDFCLHVRLASAELRLATASIGLVEPDGTRVALLPHLLADFELTDSYTPGQGGAGVRSTSISLPGEIVDCAGLLASGLMLAGDAELSVAFDGCPYIERRVLLDGDVTGGVTFGSASEPVEFEVSDPADTSAVAVTGTVVDVERHPTAADSAIGARYPLVFNMWDRVDALMTGAQSYLVCVPSIGIDATSLSVYVDGIAKSTVDADYGHTIAIASDGRGAPFWEITFTGAVTLTDEAVQVRVENTGSGGKYLHELIEHLLGAYSNLGRRRINFDLIGEVLTKIGSVPVAFLVNGSGEATTADAFSLCEDRIAKSFPMLTFAWVDGKYGPIVTDGRAAPVADFVEGSSLLQRVSAIQESDKSDLVNRFVVRGGYDSTQQTYTLVATRDEQNSILCARSAAVVGTRDADVVDGDLLTRQTDVEMVVDWRVYHEAVPSYYVEFNVPTLRALRSRPGINVRMYVPSLGWEGVVATITTRVIRRSVSTLGFRVWWASISGSNVGGGGSSGGGGSAGGAGN